MILIKKQSKELTLEDASFIRVIYWRNTNSSVNNFIVKEIFFAHIYRGFIVRIHSAKILVIGCSQIANVSKYLIIWFYHGILTNKMGNQTY